MTFLLTFLVPFASVLMKPAQAAVLALGELSRSTSSAEKFLEIHRVPLKFGLQWQGESFFSDKMPTRGRPQRLFMSLQVDAGSSRRWGALEADGFARGYLGVPSIAEYSTFEIVEASIGVAPVRREDLKLGFYLGRRRQDWSHADRIWGLGVTEPFFRWDPLRPSRNGLTGAFAELRTPGFEAVVFTSPVAVPESGPSSALRNGVFTSSHPFYLPPPESTELIGVETPIRYEIAMPPIWELVLRPSVGVLVGGEWVGFRARAAYQYKPVTRPVLALRSQGIYNLATEQIEPVLRPQVIQSHVVTLDAGYRSEFATPWLSAILDVPEAPFFDKSYTTQNFPAGGWLGLGSDFRIFRGDLQFSFLQSFLGVAPDVGPLSTGTYEGFFDSRYLFRQAVSARVQYPLLETDAHRLTWSGKAIREFSIGGTLLSTDLEWWPGRNFSVGIGADFIAADMKTAKNGGGEFLSSMQNFDRVRALLRVEL